MAVSAVMVAVAMMLQSSVDATGTAIARPTGDVKQEDTSGSYFQIFEFYGRPPHTWEHAQAMVGGYVYKERAGRLAQVKSSAIHYFLLLNFLELRENKTWIGLGAECNETADLMWIDGSLLKDQSFRAWNEGTLKKISRSCRSSKGSGKILPVFYDADEFGLRWEAGSEKQNLRHILVEFPDPVVLAAEKEKADAIKAEIEKAAKAKADKAEKAKAEKEAAQALAVTAAAEMGMPKAEVSNTPAKDPKGQ